MISGFSWPRLLQVAGDEDVGGEEDHVLLAAAEGHLEQLLQPLDGLGQVAAGERQVGPGRALDDRRRHGASSMLVLASPAESTRFSTISRATPSGSTIRSLTTASAGSAAAGRDLHLVACPASSGGW